MATTLQDIIAKRKEMGAGATNVDARKALEPVSATSQANIDQLAANKTRVQSQIQAGTRNAVGTSATPQVLGKVGMTDQEIIQAGGKVENGVQMMPAKKIEPAKVEPTVDFNKSQGREQEIQANIKQITTDNPALLKDRNAYNQAFGYETADAGKRAMLDASFTGANTPVLMNQKDIVSALVSGVSVPEQNTQAYRNATVVANQFKKFNSMTDVQLLDNLKQGQIGTELDGLLSQNPNYIKAKQDLAKFQKTASINRAISTISNVIKGNEVTQEDDLAKIESKYQPPLGANAQAYQDYVVKNPDVVSAGAQVKQLSTQISDLTKSYNDALKSIKSQYGDMPASALLTLMGSRTSETKELLDSYINAKELAKGDFDLAMKMAEGSYDAYSKDLANQAVIDKEARDLQAKKDLIQYKSDFEKKQAQEALNDPATQIQATMDEFAKLGIVAQGSLASKVAEANDVIAKGGTLGGYIDEMKKLYTEKPEYQAYLAKQKGQLSDVQKMSMAQNFDLQKMGIEQNFQMKLAQAKNVADTKWTKLDDGLYQDANGNIMTADEMKSAKLLGNSYITKATGQEGGECGLYASRATGLGSTPGGNSKEARFKAFSETTPQVGGMAFFGGDGYDKTYGHISIVTGVNADGTITVKESNFNGDGKVTERTVPASSVSGYYNNTPLAKSISGGTQGVSGQYNDQNINDLAYLTELQEKNPTQAAKDMKELGYTARDLANYKAGNVPLTEKQKTTSTDILSSITDLVTNYDWNDAVGKFDYSRVIGTQDAVDAEVAINNLIAKLTLPNLGVLKGPMSDKDIQFIKEASSKLATNQSNTSFERNLIDAYNLAARRAGKEQITKLSDINKPTSTVGGELNYSKYE